MDQTNPQRVSKTDKVFSAAFLAGIFPAFIAFIYYALTGPQFQDLRYFTDQTANLIVDGVIISFAAVVLAVYWIRILRRSQTMYTNRSEALLYGAAGIIPGFIVLSIGLDIVLFYLLLGPLLFAASVSGCAPGLGCTGGSQALRIFLASVGVLIFVLVIWRVVRDRFSRYLIIGLLLAVVLIGSLLLVDNSENQQISAQPTSSAAPISVPDNKPATPCVLGPNVISLTKPSPNGFIGRTPTIEGTVKSKVAGLRLTVDIDGNSYLFPEERQNEYTQYQFHPVTDAAGRFSFSLDLNGDRAVTTHHLGDQNNGEANDFASVPLGRHEFTIYAVDADSPPDAERTAVSCAVNVTLR